ncbi:helix-turn-helix domain-containing protein [Enterococcus faecalis]|uniref:DNA-binding helix-turn-helix protein n=1 Tax=Enterococcus faecalis RP2S-4 TaxID=1244145 RepID=A0ABC9TII4_ENTFL|nr:helix-turn-helix transcriptional regulator [Enterococcus faecalis]EGO6039738.1 helix-turn-helix transcriptional regulator [Enterococcus faecalis]EGO9465912.1 XRE family transcriptional regulator [Enterococcus faecalis]EGS1179543.1 helix-turn-helix transcriptional regulator [Enterococcus faecalis]EHB6454105.1 helix-turn-helix transcriptional regulator [Enterococcus faecalis]EHH1613853.1 helix-turn-helix transcriptional regulator [Enterococcus faecalis]
MTVFEIIQMLAKKQGKSVKDVSRELGFGESTIYKWKKQSPKAEYIEKVAQYFNVSTDYLLGRTDNPNQAGAKPSDDLDEVLDNVMSFDGEPLDDHDREVIRAYLKGRFGK